VHTASDIITGSGPGLLLVDERADLVDRLPKVGMPLGDGRIEPSEVPVDAGNPVGQLQCRHGAGRKTASHR
jgi:hypothetical protein